MKKIVYLAFVAAVLLGIICACSACKSAPSPPLDESAIRAYADPETETTLQGLSENDLDKYIQYGDAKFKAAVTQEVFDRVAAQIKDELGSYESEEFLSVETVQGYIVVHYRVHYSKGDVGVRMVFDQDHLVAGQFFE